MLYNQDLVYLKQQRFQVLNFKCIFWQLFMNYCQLPKRNVSEWRPAVRLEIAALVTWMSDSIFFTLTFDSKGIKPNLLLSTYIENLFINILAIYMLCVGIELIETWSIISLVIYTFIWFKKSCMGWWWDHWNYILCHHNSIAPGYEFILKLANL